MELLNQLFMGLMVAGAPQNLLFCLIGCILGTAIGVLPGVGPVATIAMLLPMTFVLPPVSAIIMLAGIYYGAQYGGSTTAILINIPGEASSVVTCLDGHAMARQGRGGVALAIAALGSLFAGIVSTFFLAFLSPTLSNLALSFASPEQFALMTFGLVAAIVIAHGSLLKSLVMVFAGCLLGLIGMDVNSGLQRLTFGIPELSDGLSFVALAMGLFGIAEVAVNLERSFRRDDVSSVGNIMPTRSDMKQAAPAVVRGTLLGSVLGVLPGGGALLGSFASYTLEKKLAKDSSRFGQGAIEGVAGPESANNAGAQTSFVPMLTLGIPANAVMAIMIGALNIHGISPGPLLISDQPQLFWGLIASMLVGNVMLVILNLPLISLWIKLLRVPYRILYPAIIVFCCIGTYSINNSATDVALMMICGGFGYLLLKLGFEPAPLLMGFVLAPMLEEALSRSLILSNGSFSIFIDRPLSLVFLICSVVLVFLVILPSFRRVREESLRD